MTQSLQHATFAGGCFWCIEPQFVNLPGVSDVVSGYMGGSAATATYEQVCSGTTGHIEVIDIMFDPAQVSYETLLATFWQNIDPLDPHGQFADKGSQYYAGIFTHSEAQREAAEASKAAVTKKLGQPVASFIRPAEPFYPAEDYHQRYYQKNPLRYGLYAANNGRKQRLERVWGKEET